MNEDAKSDEIMAALEAYVERQKKLIEEQNQRLLSGGQEAFERLIAEKQDTKDQDQAQPPKPARGREVRLLVAAGLQRGAFLKKWGAQLARIVVAGFGHSCAVVNAAILQMRRWLERAHTRRPS